MEKVLAGSEILLRPLRPSDAIDIYLNVRHRAISRYTENIPYPYPRKAAEKFIAKSALAWKKKEGYAFAIVSRKKAELIGLISLNKVDWKARRATIGYWLGKKHWGKGIMSAAVRMALQFAFAKLRLNKVEATAFEENRASNRVLQKAGFSHEGTVRQHILRFGRLHNINQYGLLRQEHSKRHK
ncbi:GNAT family N-acetyltransferase [Candidatus Woesearchaeota archaeon]|nr:GNAT family N-acetyltransferase [Candidatus Woesearchaeota archaeon]